MRPLVAQTFETSSIAISASSVPVPSPPSCSSKKSPKRSFSRSSSTTSHGNSFDSSAIGNGAYRAAQTLAAKTGTTVTFTNNDMMPQTLVQTAGPRLSLHAPRLAHMGASTRVTFTKPGTYRFTTKAGEDYMSGVKTVGEDNVLR